MLARDRIDLDQHVEQGTGGRIFAAVHAVEHAGGRVEADAVHVGHGDGPELALHGIGGAGDGARLGREEAGGRVERTELVGVRGVQRREVEAPGHALDALRAGGGRGGRGDGAGDAIHLAQIVHVIGVEAVGHDVADAALGGREGQGQVGLVGGHVHAGRVLHLRLEGEGRGDDHAFGLLLEAQVVAPPSPLAVARRSGCPAAVGVVLVVQVQVKVAEPLAGTVWLAGLGPVSVAQL